MSNCTYLLNTGKEGSIMTTRNPTTSRHDIERFLRVDHAGERAAQQIYKGQLAVLANHEMADEIRHMMDQEVEHLETFDSLLNERQVRPSLLDPLWGAAGFTLGVVTAAMGPKAAMACTIAVEEVIGEHYQKQADILGEDERELQATVAVSYKNPSNFGWLTLISTSRLIVAWQENFSNYIEAENKPAYGA